MIKTSLIAAAALISIAAYAAEPTPTPPPGSHAPVPHVPVAPSGAPTDPMPMNLPTQAFTVTAEEYNMIHQYLMDGGCRLGQTNCVSLTPAQAIPLLGFFEKKQAEAQDKIKAEMHAPIPHPAPPASKSPE
jgi:hypothetical protein